MGTANCGTVQLLTPWYPFHSDTEKLSSLGTDIFVVEYHNELYGTIIFVVQYYKLTPGYCYQCNTVP